MKKNRVYLAIFKMNFINGLQYRAAAFSGVLTQLFWGFIYISVYSAFFRSGSPPGSFTVEQMSTYVWLGQAFFAIRFFTGNTQAMNSIINGNISYNLVRPISLYNQWYVDFASSKISQMILRAIPIFLIVFFLPRGLNLSLPVSVGAFALFLISLCIGTFIMFAFYMFMLLFAFKTLQAKGARAIVSGIIGIFNGAFVPLPLLPIGLQNVLKFLPFASITDLSFRIYCGNTPISEAWYLILLQLAWLIVLIILGKLCYKKMIKKIEVQGG